MRQVDAHLAIAVLDEAAAVETRGDGGTAEVVGPAAHGDGLCCSAVADRRAHFAARRRVRYWGTRARGEDWQKRGQSPFHARASYASGTKFARHYSAKGPKRRLAHDQTRSSNFPHRHRRTRRLRNRKP